jgi:hypothetical protein
MNTISTAALSQPPAYAAAFDQTASTMSTMDAILARRPGHLKMPRPDAYDVLERLPSHPNHLIDELLPHRWTPAA